jgi:isopenicillin-N N-acyltransferase-like protein
MAELTVLDLGSDPRERGRVHGRSMRSEIRDNYATYVERFEAGGAKLSVVLEQSDAWAAFIARDNPEYAEEMAGVAEGAELSSTEVAMLNARYELAYCVFGSEAQTLNSPVVQEQEGCTAFGLLPEITASGHTLIGQNWDWLQKVRGHVFTMRVKRASEPAKGKPDFVGFTEAGIVGCMDLRQGPAAGGANGPLLLDELPDWACRRGNYRHRGYTGLLLLHLSREWIGDAREPSGAGGSHRFPV